MPVLLNPHNYDLNDLLICDDPDISFASSPFPNLPTTLKCGLVNIHMLSWNFEHVSMQYFRDRPNGLIIEEHCRNGIITDATYTVIKVKDYQQRVHHYVWCLRAFDMVSK